MGVVLAGLIPAACTYTGDDIGNPLLRKVQWYSYIAGDDIREACGPGAPERYRLVYNGVYEQQIRAYDINGAQRTLTALVANDNKGLTLTTADPLALWRATQSVATLDTQQMDSLTRALAGSGAFGDAAIGLELPSGQYYWTAAYCRDGQYGFTGWLYPSETFSALRFPELLFALDRTGVPVKQPGPIPRDLDREQRERRGETVSFTLKVGANGLVR